MVTKSRATKANMITTVTKTNGSSNPATKARMQAQPQSQGGLTSNIKPQRQKTSSTTVFLTVGRQEEVKKDWKREQRKFEPASRLKHVA
eukprot:CAMPEP_0194564274 /NCGR_PEP_ID=MMETSP0292-20121207/3993_1 /TAXON_ID=39354 /ORGANISM="Heterosigma akashiwo, Strain CCMP2393" /LENGTH=88 /DNA_ID=CAMNT_0039413367 /DNA_START=449 /DNA_END=715 /DNA_ORIENTATION=-